MALNAYMGRGGRPQGRSRPQSRGGRPRDRYTPTPDGGGDRYGERWWQMNRMIDAGMPEQQAINREYHGGTTPMPRGTQGGFPAQRPERIDAYLRPQTSWGAQNPWAQAPLPRELMMQAMLARLFGMGQ
jgi:hypothetical protein